MLLFVSTIIGTLIIASLFALLISSFPFLSVVINNVASLSTIKSAISRASLTSPPPLFLISIINDVIFFCFNSSNFSLNSLAHPSSNELNSIYPIVVLLITFAST